MNDTKRMLNSVADFGDHTEASQWLNMDDIFLFKFGIYTARQLCGITPSVRPFSSQLVKIFVDFIRVSPAIFKRPHHHHHTTPTHHHPPRPPPTPRSQNFTIQRRFCPALIRSFLRIAKFLTCSKTQCVAFVSNTFSCELLLCTDCNFKTNWPSCQPISHLEFVTLVFGCGPWAFSEGDIEEHRSVTRWHLQSSSSCSRDRKSYLKATWA